jgi:hypothetical protein
MARMGRRRSFMKMKSEWNIHGGRLLAKEHQSARKERNLAARPHGQDTFS